jgi:dTDP-4-dehydrorhamnose reductase
MVGAALVRRLRAESCTILTVDHATLDLTRQAETELWIGTAKPDVVILAAAKSAASPSTTRIRLTSCPIISPSRSMLLAPRMPLV